MFSPYNFYFLTPNNSCADLFLFPLPGLFGNNEYSRFSLSTSETTIYLEVAQLRLLVNITRATDEAGSLAPLVYR